MFAVGYNQPGFNAVVMRSAFTAACSVVRM